MGTIVGILDPLGAAAGEPLRGRLRGALGAEEPAWVQEQGGLVLGTAGEVERAESDGRICLLEGRLYNGEELAWQLGVPAYVSPATLLLRGYEQLGAELWPLLRGDFVVLIWDREAEAGALVRDQLGGRALFLHRTGGVVAFATELANLVELLPSRPPADDVAVAHWLLPSVVPEERTFFAGIEEVPPATCLALGRDGAQARRYWAPRFEQQRDLSFEEASAQARELLVQAVERRAGEAEASAILLSGGIDSAGVAGVACNCLPDEQRPLRAYSAVFPRHPEIDEGPLIASVAAHNRLAATAIETEPGGLLASTAPYIERWQALSPTPNLSFLRPLLNRAADDGVRLLLDGEGGDAVFWYSAPLVAERVRRGRLLSAWSLAGSFPEYGVPTTWRTRLDKLRQWGRSRDFSPVPQDWLAVPPHLLEAEDPAPGVEGPAWWVAQVAAILGPGSRMAHDVTRRNAALSGLEPSHPLLDVDLIEAVLSFPPELAFERRFNRPVLREAVAGLVPDEARLRPYKSNFDPVIVAGMEADLPLVEALLLRPSAHVGAYTNHERLADHIASPPQPLGARRAWAMSLWFLGTMECWLRLQAGEEVLPADALSRIGTPGYSFSSL
ncbi:MAG TPA: asparagine synthase-related protein [Solirubrobacterales bacterium]|nr:asparagine synthase-related protein [Solirubrobacterales bacterium]